VRLLSAVSILVFWREVIQAGHVGVCAEAEGCMEWPHLDANNFGWP
jgi:hypothetical protein